MDEAGRGPLAGTGGRGRGGGAGPGSHPGRYRRQQGARRRDSAERIYQDASWPWLASASASPMSIASTADNILQAAAVGHGAGGGPAGVRAQARADRRQQGAAASISRPAPSCRATPSASSIAAASIVAKVARDAMMTELARSYPHYGFDRHKGYGTREHQAAIARYGVTPHHRRSFRPVQLALGLVLTPAVSIRCGTSRAPWNGLSMMRRLYDWMMRTARNRRAPHALFWVSFIESSIFPIPPDVMLIPMILANRAKRSGDMPPSCTIGSVLGGMAGYAIGYYVFEYAWPTDSGVLRLWRQISGNQGPLRRVGSVDPDRQRAGRRFPTRC